MKYEVKLLIYSQTLTAAPLKFGNVKAITRYTLQGIWILIHAGIKVNLC